MFGSSFGPLTPPACPGHSNARAICFSRLLLQHAATPGHRRLAGQVRYVAQTNVFSRRGRSGFQSVTERNGVTFVSAVSHTEAPHVSKEGLEVDEETRVKLSKELIACTTRQQFDDFDKRNHTRYLGFTSQNSRKQLTF